MIAVNLVTGFLGVGKTTLLRHLLRQHPAEQRWAVLVNEFGEVGVDRALLDDQGVAIEEVAGGCLCCVAAPAFTVGLNRLIREHQPARILIEPSGLGHPAQLLETLRSPLYQQVLDIQATLCVMDARHLASPRHREHPNFIDQVHLADILVANKADLHDEHAEQAFMRFAATLQPPKSRLVITQQGRIDAALLQLGTQSRQAAFPEAHAFLIAQGEAQGPAPRGDWIRASGEGDGYHHVAWLIDRPHIFQREALLAWLDQLPVDRAKGVFRCAAGWISYNRSSDAARVETVAASEATRLQLIDHAALDASQLDRALRQKLLTA
jgi:G3E family GTPase